MTTRLIDHNRLLFSFVRWFRALTQTFERRTWYTLEALVSKAAHAFATLHVVVSQHALRQANRAKELPRAPIPPPYFGTLRLSKRFPSSPPPRVANGTATCGSVWAAPSGEAEDSLGLDEEPPSERTFIHSFIPPSASVIRE